MTDTPDIPDTKYITSSNEINNIIYLLLKYNYRINTPDNKDITEMVLVVLDDPSVDRIIDEVYKYVKVKYPHEIDMKNFERQMRHTRFLIEEFMKMPESARTDLGADAENGDCLIKH